jgi:putative flippase GtrA
MEMTFLRRKKITLKFVVVSGINFLVGYVTFSLAWLSLKNYLSYLPIATLATALSAVWSFQSHNRITLERKSIKNFISIQYLLFQLVALLVSSLCVPVVAEYMEVNLLLVQLFWTIFLSLIGLVVLVRYSN